MRIDAQNHFLEKLEEHRGEHLLHVPTSVFDLGMNVFGGGRKSGGGDKKRK